MGQGAESAGGYEVDYNPYYELIGDGIWTQKNGSTIHVSNMADSHIRNSIKVCKKARVSANFSCDEDLWSDWIELFENELFYREKTGKSIKSKFEGERKKRKPNKTIRRALGNISPDVNMLDMICHCGLAYTAKVADLKRGWGLSCSKSCAAIRKKYNKQPAQPKVAK